MTGTGGIDFYDVDHTILRGTTGVQFLLLGVRHGIFPPLALLYLPLLVVRYRLGLINGEFRDRAFRALRGRRREAIDELARLSYAAVRRRIYPEARRLIEDRRSRGRRAVFATSSVDVIVRPFARELGVEDVLAVSLELDGERYTGRLAGPPLFGERKKAAVLDYMRESGVGPERCAFFTDSITDLPLLNAVGEPVAVNPDGRLRTVARRRGWPILRFGWGPLP